MDIPSNLKAHRTDHKPGWSDSTPVLGKLQSQKKYEGCHINLILVSHFSDEEDVSSVELVGPVEEES
jgi:hypothetical protein